MKIGVLIGFHQGVDLEKEFKKALDMELNCCQLCCWDTSLYTKENAEQIRILADQAGIEITGLWAGWDGPKEWNFYGGPSTLGLVPPAYRFARLKELFAASDFAAWMGVSDLITHVGFIPEDPNNSDFAGLVTALRSLTSYMKKKNQYFLFETGQETPVTLLRAIEEIGTGNLGINLDTANLIMYGKASSVDSLDVFGKYVRNTHCKDGLYPSCGKELGPEVALGEGKANFPVLIKRLHELGYTGPLVMEREISGEQQIKDIASGRDFLKTILKDLGI